MTMRVLDEQWQQENPLVTANEWPFDRQGDDELSVSINGGWCDYHLGFSFCAEQGGMQLACAYDMRVPANRMRDVHTLLAHINERMWLEADQAAAAKAEAEAVAAAMFDTMGEA